MEVKSILVPFDFGSPAVHALDQAKGIADRFGSSIELLHVVSDPFLPDPYMPLSPEVAAEFLPRTDLVKVQLAAAEARLQEVLDPAERAALHVRSTVRSGDPRSVILQHAEREKPSLIVMGTHGRTGVAHLLLGSVAEKVVREAPCPVMTVR